MFKYYRIQRPDDNSSDSSMSSSTSSAYDSSVPDSVPSLDHHSVESSEFDTPQESAVFDSPSCGSVNTYCTTVEEFDDDYEEEEDEEERRQHHHQNHDYHGYHYSRSKPPVPATPQEFAEHFPSTKRLIIKHDESPLDGNMNIRVDCDAPTRREHDRRTTLFHLRMYDLRDRDFSVRRYGRDCGREVAHVKRKKTTSVLERPALRKALSSLRSKLSTEEIKKVERVDSGYASNPDDDDEAEPEACSSSSSPAPGRGKQTNTMTLEFSNYAHVDITRRGPKSSKKYDFEYWGKSYSWRRRSTTTTTAAGLGREYSYQLTNNATNNVVASIRPDPVTPTMMAIQERHGGCVPPCSMYINNSTADPVNSENADVADVIVTTGLIALVDDCLKRKYHKKRSVQLVLPITGKMPLNLNMEYVGPKRFIDEMFNRRPLPVITRSQSAQFERRTSPTPPRRMFTN